MHFLIIMFELGLHGEIIVNSRRQEEQLIKKKPYIIVNFRAREISRSTRKLTRTPR